MQMSKESVRIVKITGNHSFTHDEIESLKTNFIISDQKIDGAEQEKKSFNAGIKARIEELQETKQTISRKLSNQYEERLIECYEEKNYTEGIISYVEVETGSIIQERKMTGEDRQQNIFDKTNELEPVGEDKIIAEDMAKESVKTEDVLPESDIQEVNEMVDEVMAEQENAEPDEPAEEVESEIDESLPGVSFPNKMEETFALSDDEDYFDARDSDDESDPDDDDNPFD